MENITKEILSVTVSSVLNRDVKQFGKQFLLDENDDTCWNSDQGDSQHITINFGKEVKLQELEIQFQGGFSCKQLDILQLCPEEHFLQSIYPEDINFIQKFDLRSENCMSKVKLKFLRSTDLFGRIVIYHLRCFGQIS